MDPEPFAPLLPTPRQWSRGPVEVLDARSVTLPGDAPPGAVRILTEGLSRRGIEIGGDRDVFPIRLLMTETLSGEEYAIRAGRTAITVTAGTVGGLCRGAATTAQLLRRQEAGGPIEVATGTIEDGPVVPLRMLAGWGLYRDHRLEDALDVATLGGFNRVLYNWWSAVPGERMPARAGRLVRQAREQGMELVCELRRQVLGPRFSLADAAAVSSLLRLYDEAVDQGFRCFGLLFDDTDLDLFEDEIGLLKTVVAHLHDRLGHAPEMWFCPRFYWFPGDLDYSWLPRSIGPTGPGQVDLTAILGAAERRSPEEATARQEHYQELLAASLAPGTLVYLATWWGGTPDGWEQQLAGWRHRLGPPAFWDNQQQNDARLANVMPAPLDHRPPAFAEALAGYALNSGVPLGAYAPASVTAGAWAWNPHGYDAAAAFDAALRELLGPVAAVPAGAGITRWRDLVAGLVEPDAGARYHVPGLRRAAAEARGDQLRREMAAVVGLLDEARTAVRDDALALDLLDELVREPHRICVELELAELAEARSAGAVSSVTARARAEQLCEELRSHLTRRLPPAPGLDVLLDADRLDLTRPSPALSWFLHFHASAIQNGVAHLLAEIEAAEGEDLTRGS